jgi:hypothetical protein
MLLDTITHVGRALTFSAGAFDELGVRASLSALALAACAQALGQSMILALNRVGAVRFVIALAAMALSNAFSSLVMVSGAVVAGSLLLQSPLGPVATLSVFASAFAPRLFSPLIIAPYVGEPIDRLIEIWVMLLVVFGLHQGLELHLAAATAVAGLGWLSLRATNLLLGWPLGRLLGRLKTRFLGGSPLTFANIGEALLESARGGGPK